MKSLCDAWWPSEQAYGDQMFAGVPIGGELDNNGDEAEPGCLLDLVWAPADPYKNGQFLWDVLCSVALLRDEPRALQHINAVIPRP